MNGTASQSWQVIEGGITAPQGFRAAAVAAGLKPSGATDLTLIVSLTEATAAGVFTTNEMKAACVTQNQAQLATEQPVRAILCNAGQANACTGEAGLTDNLALTRLVGDALQIPPTQVLTASTGVIGKRLAIAKVAAALPQLAHQALTLPVDEGGAQAAQGILTTDLVVKVLAVEGECSGQPVRVGGIAKGSGMIHPDMATMLAFVTCDAQVEPALWRQMVRTAADLSFNQITVDGDTSTNDMLLGLANGQAGNLLITADSPAAQLLQNMLNAVCIHLAKAIARDGEGATKLLEIQVDGAKTAAAARQMARVIAGSPLVKAAAFGNDPNWGRVAAAAGRSGVPFAPDALDIYLGDTQLMAAGVPLPFDAAAARAYLKGDPVTFRLDLHQGEATGCAWGCDLSYDYVRINAEYTT